MLLHLHINRNANDADTMSMLDHAWALGKLVDISMPSLSDRFVTNKSWTSFLHVRRQMTKYPPPPPPPHTWGSTVGQLGERCCLPSELHTNLVRVCASPALKYFQSGRCINLSKCMWSGYRQANLVVSQAYSGMPRYVLAFLHLRQLTVAEKGLWVVWCNSGEVMLRLRGRDILIGMITD